MNRVLFTLYTLPHGAASQVTYGVTDETFAAAEVILSEGFGFEIEQLRTGEFSLDVCGMDADGEHDSIAMTREPEHVHMSDAIGRLVAKASAALLARASS